MPRTPWHSPPIAWAVTNIVHNALRHGAAPIQVTAALKAGQAEIHVRDRGKGFPPAFLPDAFDRFTRAPTARDPGLAPGSGWPSPQPSPAPRAAATGPPTAQTRS